MGVSSNSPEVVLLTIDQTGTQVRGAIEVAAVPVSSSKVVETSADFSSTVHKSGSAISFTVTIQGSNGTFTRQASGGPITTNIGGSESTFQPSSKAKFEALVTKDTPTLIAQAESLNDRVTKSNLTNAMTEAKALYQVNQSYGQGKNAYTAQSLHSQAPEFDWTAGACSSTTDCISMKVVDLAAQGDRQGIVLAALSPTGTCFYFVDLEVNPALLSKDSAAFWRHANGPDSSASSAGVDYAWTSSAQKMTSCWAGSVLSSSAPIQWEQSLTNSP
jgi:hypothetical protein